MISYGIVGIALAPNIVSVVHWFSLCLCLYVCVMLLKSYHNNLLKHLFKKKKKQDEKRKNKDFLIRFKAKEKDWEKQNIHI